MRARDMLQRRYLAKEDLSGDDGSFDQWLLTITRCALEDMPGDQGEQRWALYFKEHSKGLILNATTIRFLEKEFGEESDEWANHKVILYCDPAIQFKGQVVGGLRLKSVRPTKPVVVVPKSPKASPGATPELDDEIPFE